MKRINLTQGKYAIVDDEDYHYLNRFDWAYRENKNKLITVCRSWQVQYRMHHLTMENSIFVRKVGCHNPIAWKNGNRLDFRKCNLTTLTNGISGTNQRAMKQKDCLSKHKGVSQYKKTGIWRGQIERGRRKTLEYICLTKMCNTEKEAAIWYNKKAKELYGELAYQNIII